MNILKKNIDKFFLFLVSVFFSVLCFGFIGISSAADGRLPDAWKKPIEQVHSIQRPVSSGEDGAIETSQDMINVFFQEILFPLLQYVFIGVGLIFLGIYAYMLALGSGQDEQITEQRTNIIFAAAGFIVVALAPEFIKILDPEEKTNTLVNIEQVDSVLLTVVNFMQLALGAIAIAAVFYGGIRLITYNGVEERLTDGKNIMLYGFLGFVFVMLAEPMVNGVFYPNAGDANVNVGDEQAATLIEQVFGILKFLFMFFGAIIFIAFVYAGFLFITSGINEDQKETAKRVLLWTVIGFVIIVISYSLVMFFIPNTQI